MKWVLFSCLSMFVSMTSAGTASFDCSAARSKVERLICADAGLSRQDEELAKAYTAALEDAANADAIRREQRRWLGDRNMCPARECIQMLQTDRLAALKKARQAYDALQEHIEQDRKVGFKGEFILLRVLNQNPICEPFTKNLNEFRRLDFDECHPRLSEKYPQFSRPDWREVPLDLAIAEKAFKDFGGSRLKPGEGHYWQNWLKETTDLRATGKVKMWLAEVDINNDGQAEQISRVQYAHPASPQPIRQRSCVYQYSGLWMTSKLKPDVLYSGGPHFYFGSSTDIIYFKDMGQYYAIQWNEVPSDPEGVGLRIGATGGVTVELAQTVHSSLSPVCYIGWVPTGHFRPLKKSTDSAN